MIKYSEFHRFILKHGRKRGWKQESKGNGSSHYIYVDKDGLRYPVPYHSSKEMGEGLRKKIIRDMELE